MTNTNFTELLIKYEYNSGLTIGSTQQNGC